MNKVNDYFTIKQAARYIGVTPNTLRNWEEQKKLIPQRNPFNNYRMYKQEDLEQVLTTIAKETIAKDNVLNTIQCLLADFTKNELHKNICNVLLTYPYGDTADYFDVRTEALDEFIEYLTGLAKERND